MTHYNVAIIGSGPGGYVAAIKAAQLGLKVAIIEQNDIGGTCLNRGCIPTKTLLQAAKLLEESKNAAEFGLHISEVSVDFEALAKRKQSVVAQLRDGVEALLLANDVDIIRGHAFVESTHRIKITSVLPSYEPCLHEGASEEKEGSAEALLSSFETNFSETFIETDNIIVAAGTSPAIPPIAGADLPGVYSSDSILAELPNINHLVIVGGGVIGLEFAGIYSAFGTQVSVLEASAGIASAFDREIGQTLTMTLKRKGCSINAKTFVKGIRKNDDDSLCVEYEQKGELHQIEADAVLIAVGRKAAAETLFNEEIVPACERGRILVDSNMRSSIEGIYAIGDISTAGPQLAHAASAQGIMAASIIANKPCSINLSITPACVYSSPEIACVGLTEVEAKEAGIEAKVGKYSLSGNAKSIISKQSRSFIKVVSDQNGIIIGAQLMCARATDIIGEFAIAIANGLTVAQIQNIVRPHPTFEEAVGEALESITGDAIHVMPKR